MDDSSNHPQWVKAAEAKDRLDISDSTLRRWAAAGHIRTARTPGNQRRYARADVERIARDGVVPPAPAEPAAVP